MEVIINELNCTVDTILQNPAILQSFNRNSVNAWTIQTTYSNTWDSESGHGRCTSFACKVATQLEETYPGMYDFQYFDIGGHRVARCKKTAVLIDSNADRGANVLPDHNQWTNWEGITGWWMYHQGISQFARQASGDEAPEIIDAIPKHVAMGICLEEAANVACLLCLFR